MLTENEKLLVVRAYLNNNASIIQTFRALRGIINPIPSIRVIRHVVDHLYQTGRVYNTGNRNRNHPVTENPVLVDRIRASLRRNPKKSLRKLAAETNSSLTSVQKIVRKNLKYKPYKIQRVQKLEVADFQSRLNFSDWCIERMNDNRIDFLNNLLISDEAHFDLTGIINIFTILLCLGNLQFHF